MHSERIERGGELESERGEEGEQERIERDLE